MVRRRIFPIATDAAACYLYRLHWPLTHLPADEFEIIWGGFVGDQPGDVVVGQRLAGDNQAWRDMCADPNILAVYEIDDDIVDMDPANETPYAIFHPQRDGTIANIAAADVVTCSTPYLAAKIAQRWNPRTVVLPNCLPAKWYADPPRCEHNGKTPIIVGWAGSPFHAQDFVGLGEQLAKVHSDRGIWWHTIGADYLSPHVPVSRSVGWTTNDHLLAELNFDIGLAPLNGSESNRSKSWAKLLEYGARGIPSISSWLGEDHAYGHWFAEGQDRPEETAILNAPGIVVDRLDSDFWAAAIELLCDDDDRAVMGAAARARAERYEISRQVHRWAQVYRRTPEAAR